MLVACEHPRGVAEIDTQRALELIATFLQFRLFASTVIITTFHPSTGSSTGLKDWHRLNKLDLDLMRDALSFDKVGHPTTVVLDP